MTRSPRNRWFGYAFIVAGFIPIGMAGTTVWNWTRASSWVPTEASVVAIDLMTRSGTGPRGRSTSTTLSAKYEYQWDGGVVSADGISPFNSIECFVSYKRKIAERLRTARAKGETVTCYVNANSPGEAFLNREFRWMPVLIVLAIGMLFTGVGFRLVRQQSNRAG